MCVCACESPRMQCFVCAKASGSANGVAGSASAALEEMALRAVRTNFNISVSGKVTHKQIH